MDLQPKTNTDVEDLGKSNIDMICAKETGKTQTVNHHDLTRPANVYRPEYLTTIFENSS